MMDRHFTVDPNVDMLVAFFVFTPKKDSNSAIRDRMFEKAIEFGFFSNELFRFSNCTIGKSLYLY